MIDNELKFDFERLLLYGFKLKDEIYYFEQSIMDDNFLLIVTIDKNHCLKHQIIEKESNEPYDLIDVIGANGTFVVSMREEVEKIENRIIACCTSRKLDSQLTIKISNYIKEQYNDNLEYLWKDDFDDAVFRHHDTKVWYGIIMKVSKRKLGIEKEGNVEVLNLKNESSQIELLFKERGIFPAYHMNKKHWCSIILDGTIPFEKIVPLIDVSYRMTSMKKRTKK